MSKCDNWGKLRDKKKKHFYIIPRAKDKITQMSSEVLMKTRVNLGDLIELRTIYVNIAKAAEEYMLK